VTELTKFRHSCVRLDDGDRTLVIDPGVFSELDAALDGANGVLVTHEHPDHLHVERLRAAAEADPRLRIWGPGAVVATLDVGEQAVAVSPGESFEAAGFGVRAYGSQHALIHPLIPVVANLGYLIDGGVYHPGDSFTVPDAEVSTLLLPTNAPWSKVSEVIDFAIAVRARSAYPIHDWLVTGDYVALVEGHIARLAGPFGVNYQHLESGQSVPVG
jgi:L-ascorbate metabolism protein UlaG (beta-lactamase superfamily)